jgi:hypothetical protein
VSLSDKTATFSEWVTVDLGNPNVNLRNDDHRRVMLTVNIGEERKERVIDMLPIRVEDAPASAKPTPTLARVTLYGPASAIDAITPEDITVSVNAATAAAGRGISPVVTLSPAYADRVVVRAVEPKSVRVR